MNELSECLKGRHSTRFVLEFLIDEEMISPGI